MSKRCFNETNDRHMKKKKKLILLCFFSFLPCQLNTFHIAFPSKSFIQIEYDSFSRTVDNFDKNERLNYKQVIEL
jgi:hypothetical protein